jgi:glycosyltransferase involved in cell wall biosynthesis
MIPNELAHVDRRSFLSEEATNDSLKVSVVVPARNEEKFIGAFLDSVLANDYPRDDMEILIVDGMSTDGTPEIVREYAQRYPFIRLLGNPKRIIPAALNVGIKSARGEIIVRMDAHTTYAPDYIRVAVHALETTGAAMIGGIQRPTGSTLITQAIAAATSSPFGMGNSYYHYGTEMRWVDDSVYLGTWHRSTLMRLGGFNENWLINEDSELNERLRASGGKILLNPNLKVSYQVRGSFGALAQQFFRYGFWRAKTLAIYPTSLGWRHLVPPAFLVSLLLSLLSLLMMRRIFLLALLVPCAYLLINLFVSGKIVIRQGWNRALAPMAFATVHVSWGTGFLLGLGRFYPRRWLNAITTITETRSNSGQV